MATTWVMLLAYRYVSLSLSLSLSLCALSLSLSLSLSLFPSRSPRALVCRYAGWVGLRRLRSGLRSRVQVSGSQAHQHIADILNHEVVSKALSTSVTSSQYGRWVPNTYIYIIYIYIGSLYSLSIWSDSSFSQNLSRVDFLRDLSSTLHTLPYRSRVPFFCSLFSKIRCLITAAPTGIFDVHGVDDIADGPDTNTGKQGPAGPAVAMAMEPRIERGVVHRWARGTIWSFSDD